MKYRGLCVINSYSYNLNNEYKIKRLQEEGNAYSMSFEVMDALSLLPLCYGDKTILSALDDFDFVIYLDKDNYLAKVISSKKKMFNSYESLLLSDDKMLSILSLEKYGIKAPLTIPAPLCYTDSINPIKIEKFFSFLEDHLSYPMVFKENHGSLGKQVKLIQNRKELEECYSKYKKIPHLYERFLKKNKGHDYRFIVIDNKVVAVMERVNENDFRSNIALGGKGFDATGKPPPSFEKMAIDSAKALDLSYAGVDIGMDDENQPVFLEANGNAFFTEIEKVTRHNIAKEIIEMILKKLN